MFSKFTDDTIVAAATPAGFGPIAVIRISGPDSINKVDCIFKGKNKLSDAEANTIHYGKIIQKDEVIDDVLVSVFRSPNSYTGEDSIEISTHGNPFITKKIIELLIEQNVRPAEPGEFTRRAFLNNKIDLAQAEAVVDVINTRTDASLRGARNQLDGILSSKVNELRESLINASSYLELELDFADENIELIKRDELLSKINAIKTEIGRLLGTYSFGRVIRDGVHVAIAGLPNVGKSSLLNYILKESRAIVSHLPGTTRDIIREEVSIDGVLFKLYDTAGFRLSEDAVEKEGVNRSREAVKIADIILLLGDTELGFSIELEREVKELNSRVRVFKVLNKIDLVPDSKIKADLYISAKTGEGVDKLLVQLKEVVLGTSNYSEKDAIISNIRHYKCLEVADGYLDNAKKSIKENLSSEFIASDLRAVESSLGEIIGLVMPDDILNNIFSNFCIGK